MYHRHREGSKGTVWLAMQVFFPTEGGRRQMPFASKTLRANVNGRYYRDSSWHGIPTRASFSAALRSFFVAEIPAFAYQGAATV